MMHRLLIVDDEEIITDSLYEVFNQLMPDELDVYRAYSGKEAMGWLSRTRIDIVLTDIRMPGMSGLELKDEIQNYWPRCRIIFLTGHSEFDYAYQAMQVPNVRYLLKTEGYDKVVETVREVMEELRHHERMGQLVDKSRELMNELELTWQRDYFCHLIQQSAEIEQDVLVRDFKRLNIRLDVHAPVVLVLGHLEYRENLTYMERREQLNEVRLWWHSFFAEHVRSVGINDSYGDVLWFIQPNRPHHEEHNDVHFLRFLEGTMELIQQTVMEANGLALTFVMSDSACRWREVSQQYERLHLLCHLRFGGGLPAILRDRDMECEDLAYRDAYRMKQKVEALATYLDAGKFEEYNKGFDELMMSVVALNPQNAALSIEVYYGIALSLLGHIHRSGLQTNIRDYNKLMRFDDHPSLSDAFLYLYQVAGRIFELNRLKEKDRAARMIDRVRAYIDANLSEDLSLVRLAEIHYFNPSYLSRLFKQEKGMNLSEYIEQCRIAKAKQLLADRDLKVREVAAAVGYEAAHSFTRFFKKTTGLSPQEYRDQLVGG